jgi:hypothetical protein
MLRDLASTGFNADRQGVMMSGRTRDHQISVIVGRRAIEESFPKIASKLQCVAFVERNLEPFRGIVNGKLKAGRMTEFAIEHGWPDRALFVEVTNSDIAQSRRWLVP